MRGLGYIKDRPSVRDHLFAAHRAAQAPIPRAGSVRDERVFAKQQGNTSACVGETCAQGGRLAFLKLGVECPELSGSYIYRIARNIDGTEGDVGSQLRSGVHAMMRLGCAPERDMPFSEAHINDQPTFAQMHAAFDRNGLRKYYRIAAGDTDSVKRAIAAGFPVVGGWDVDRAFTQNDGRATIDVIRGAIIGGHAMCIEDYEGDVFGIIGSWGSDYGHSGHIKVTRGFVAQGTDLWALDVSGGPR